MHQKKKSYLYKKDDGQVTTWNYLTQLPLSSYSYTHQFQQKRQWQMKRSAGKHLYEPQRIIKLPQMEVIY